MAPPKFFNFFVCEDFEVPDAIAGSTLVASDKHDERHYTPMGPLAKMIIYLGFRYHECIHEKIGSHK